MPYISKEERERAKWLDLGKLEAHVCTAEGCSQDEAREQIVRALTHGAIWPLRWDPEPASPSSSAYRFPGCPPPARGQEDCRHVKHWRVVKLDWERSRVFDDFERTVFPALSKLWGDADPIIGSDDGYSSRARAEDRKRTALALDMWGESGPVPGTPVEPYLRARGITLPIPTTMRFLSVYGSYGGHPSGARRPQLIALVEHVEFGSVAVSRTFLAPDGSGKASVSPARLFTGPVGGGAVRLAPIRPDQPLAIGEGLETTLSVMQACHLAGWAALSAIGIEKLILPPEARTVLICADHDANGVGERAARRAAKRFIAEGRKVRLAMPPLGLDFNDLLMGGVSRINECAI